MRQTVTRVYLLRHAESDRSVRDGRVRPLTESGELAARALVSRFEGIALDAVYSSPFRRALDTVGPLARARSLPVQVLETLRERRSDREPIDDWPAFYLRQWQDFSYTLSDGEALGEVQARQLSAMAHILAAERGRAVLVGTHGTALATLLRHYDPSYSYDDYMALLPVMPWVVRLEFVGDACAAIAPLPRLSGPPRPSGNPRA